MAKSSTPLFASSGEGKPLNLLGMTSELLVTSDDTGGLWCLFEQIVPPGLGVPPHNHSREDEIFFILEGTVNFIAGEETISAKAGDVIHAPRGVPHGYEATGDCPARLRFMALPGNLENMFLEMSKWPTNEPPDMEKLSQLCSKFGIKFV